MNDKQYNAFLSDCYTQYTMDVTTLTNRQLLKYERLERERLADMERMKAQQAGKPYMWYQGNNLLMVEHWEKLTHATTMLELNARGYVYNGVKYVKDTTKAKV